MQKINNDSLKSNADSVNTRHLELFELLDLLSEDMIDSGNRLSNEQEIRLDKIMNVFSHIWERGYSGRLGLQSFIDETQRIRTKGPLFLHNRNDMKNDMIIKIANFLSAEKSDTLVGLPEDEREIWKKLDRMISSLWQKVILQETPGQIFEPGDRYRYRVKLSNGTKDRINTLVTSMDELFQLPRYNILNPITREFRKAMMKLTELEDGNTRDRFTPYKKIFDKQRLFIQKILIDAREKLVMEHSYQKQIVNVRKGYKLFIRNITHSL